MPDYVIQCMMHTGANIGCYALTRLFSSRRLSCCADGPFRGGGTGPADPASAGPIILAQLVNIHTNAHAKPYLPLVYSMLDGQDSSLEFKY